MKVLVADKLPPSGLSGLEAAGFEVESDPGLKDDPLVERIKETGAEVLIVRSTKVSRAALESGKLGLVVRAGAGVNTIDVAAASQLGVYVANCPGKNAIAVAELTWGLILALDRRIPDCVQDLRQGSWKKKEYAKAQGLHGRTLGLIGLGAIGREVAYRAAAFGMPVVAWSRSLTPRKADVLGVERAESPLEVARQADVLSIHVALNDDTRGMVDAELLGAMKPGAFFINTARGGVVDPEALAEAIEGGLRCGMDVWPVQPSSSMADFEDPLGKLPGVFGTHHIGASTQQAQDAVATEAVRVAKTFKDIGEVPNCVNLSPLASPGDRTLVIRHLDRVGVLAFVLEQLKGAEINVHEMKNVIFTGENAAACATIRVSAAPPDRLLEQLGSHEHILDIQLA